MTVFAGCLTQESRQKLENENLVLIGKIFPVELDVTNEESVIAAKEYVQAKMLPGQYFWALVNNAGYFAWFGPDAWLSIEHYQNSMNTNVYGMIRCVHAFLPLIKQSQGRIVSMSSVSGRYPQAHGITYCMAKYAVEVYMDGIRQELRPYSITCCMLEPGAFNTNFLSMTAMKQRVEDVWNQLSPDMQQEYGLDFKEKYLQDFEALIQSSSSKLHKVVDAYQHAITGSWPRLRYRIGWDCQMLVSLSFLPTELSDLALRFLFNTYRVPAILQKKMK
uniref:Uncharacterized protein n=1 Tax=Ditylenchus dipsaci TaxID=166011 RepID=A0A915D9L2_9BILA